MQRSAQEVFQVEVRPLPAEERLRLAALILDDLTHAPLPLTEVEHTWSERDQAELTALTLQYAASIYPEDEELV